MRQTPRTIGAILAGYHPDTLIHLTNHSAESFASGIDEETSFARLGDVAHFTVPDYQAQVVGSGAAAGPRQPVSGFVVAVLGAPGAFGRVPVANYANVPEYVNGRRFLPSTYVTLDNGSSE